VRPLLGAPQVTRRSDTVVDVVVPSPGELCIITSPETVALQLPAATVKSANVVTHVEPPALIVRAAPGTVAILGNFRAASEGILVDGSTQYSLAISLTGGAWVADVDGVTLFSGMRSRQSEPAGFNAVIRPALISRYLVSPSSVFSRQSDSQVVISLAEFSSYAISEPETIHLKLAGALMLAGQPISPSAAESIIIFAEPGIVSASFVLGELTATAALPLPTDAHVRAPNELLLQILLEGDSFAPDLGHHVTDSLTSALVQTDSTRQLLENILTLSSGSTAWNAIVWPAMQGGFERVHRVNDTTVVVRLPRSPLYRLETAHETVRVSLLPGTLHSAYSLVRHDAMATTVQIGRAASMGAQFTSGTLLACSSATGRDALTAASIASAANTLELMLEMGAKWNASLAANDTRSAFVSSSGEASATSWAVIVRPHLTFQRPSSTVLTVTLPRARFTRDHQPGRPRASPLHW